MKRQAPNKDNRRIRKLLAWSLIAIIGLVSIAGYVILSITLNGPAPHQEFDGQAFLLQPATESTADKIQLTASSDAQGDRPYAEYYISVCGSRPYDADLVLTGNAQLAQIQPQPIQFGYAYPLVQVKGFSGNLQSDIFANPYGGLNLASDGGQIVSIDFRTVHPCQTVQDEASVTITGVMSGPMQRSWAGPWRLWHGPHASQSWPQIGISSYLGPRPFTLGEISGYWTVPGSLNMQVRSVYPIDWSIDSTLASPSLPGLLVWSSANDIFPDAQLTDTASAALLQDWIVACAVGFGISGAMLASLLFEWIRPRELLSNSPDQGNFMNSGKEVPRSWQPQRVKSHVSNRLVLLGVIFTAGYIRRRQRRRNS